MSDYISQLPEAASAPNPEARARVRRGIVYGLLMGGAFALAAGVIDYYALPDLPLRVEWPVVLARMAAAGAVMAALMALIAWPEGFWRGMLLGAAVTGLTVITVTMIQAASQLRAGMVLLFFLLPAYSVLSLPFALALRWILHRHEQNVELAGLSRRPAQIGLVVLVALASAWAGTWLKMSDNGQRAVRRVDAFMQEALAKPSDADLPYVLKDLAGFGSHAGVPYYLTLQPDRYSLEGFDVTVSFDDGYRVTCLALLLPRPSVNRCAEGGSPYR